jgi:hypothetical protein
MSSRKPFALYRVWLLALLLLFGAGFLVGVQAQTSTVGNISGVVRDANGASVAQAEILIQEETTGFSRTVKTNDEGFYSAPRLPLGVYTITATSSGFKKAARTGVQLHVADDLVINFDLAIGDISETVTVIGGEQTVDTRSGGVGSLVSEKQVTELPLNGRNYAQLVTLVPGISPVTQAGAGGAFNARGTGLDSGVDLSANGNASNTNLWTVDGVNNMDVGSNSTLSNF